MRIETHRLRFYWLAILATLVIALALSACSNGETATPDQAATPTALSAAPAPQEPEPTATPTPTPTATPTPQPTATLTTQPTATPTPEPARPTSIAVSPATVDLTELGATAQLRAEVRDQNSAVMTGFTVTWTTSANSVAEVDAAGVVTAASNGTATITASTGSASGSALVTVAQEVASVEVSPSVTELTAWGETFQLAAEALDANRHPVAVPEFTWESADALVAKVDAAGVVTADGNGTATITASAGSASGSAVVMVTQEVASVEVSPPKTDLTAWGETVQLTAEALDANGHPVVGTLFSWESADALVAEVDALGLVSGIGEGEATITASAGAASGSAMVTVPPTFTLSGTVRDSRKNGPALAGAHVRLENGKRESMIVGPNGRYRFPNVWGTVTVGVTAWPTHGTETVEIAMEGDRTLDFNLEHTGTPPFRSWSSISPQVIEPSDPTRLGRITYAGRGERRVWDDRPEAWITINAYLFNVRYAGQVVEFRVNSEFGSREAAQAEVETYAHVLGQMPAVLMPSIWYVDINAGEGSSYFWVTRRLISIHNEEWDSVQLEELFVLGAAHVTLYPAHYDSPGWRAAQEADGVFISEHARDNPHKDVRDSFLAWFAVRYQSERLTAAERIGILWTIPNRLIYFDEQGFDMSPYTPWEVQYLTIQGKVIGPDNQPVEGIFVRASSGSGNYMERTLSEEEGFFVIVVPDGSFILEVYAPDAGGHSHTFVGWHGSGGFTTVREDATRFKVDGESVLDIVIRLPDHPYALPRIEWQA